MAMNLHPWILYYRRKKQLTLTVLRTENRSFLLEHKVESAAASQYYCWRPVYGRKLEQCILQNELFVTQITN